MAALTEPLPPPPEIRDLRGFSSFQLNPILQAESGDWERLLDWDFSKSADLVRRFVDLRALNGAVMMDDRTLSGYCYYVYEEHKGLVGDLYVLEPFRTPERELLLLRTVVQEMVKAPFVTRIESQLMHSPLYPRRKLPYSEYAKIFERQLMLAGLDGVRSLPARDMGGRIRFDNWADYYQEAAAVLIEEAYRDHIDSRINDQYRTLPGARKFLYNIVNYPGCGTFAPPASIVAISSAGILAGLSLASLVNNRTGHITQICVAPEFRGIGLGYELMRRSLLRFAEAEFRHVSLTVTSINKEAIRLYLDLGFKKMRSFHAYVWEGWHL